MTMERNFFDAEMVELLDDNEKLKIEVEKLELQIFQLKKTALKQPMLFKPKKFELLHRQAASMNDVNHQTRRLKLEKILSHYLRYGGIMVKEYVSNSCTVFFDISLSGKSVAQYAIKMFKVAEPDQWILKKFHLPIGFSLDAVNNKCVVMTKNYFLMIHKALTKHHDRLWQIEELKKILPNYTDLSYCQNGTLIELLLHVKNRANEESEISKFSVVLQYDSFESRPNNFEITQFGISDIDDINTIKSQLEPFYSVTLSQAFLMAFMNEQHQYYCLSDMDMVEHERNMMQNEKSKRKQSSMNKNNHYELNCNTNANNFTRFNSNTGSDLTNHKFNTQTRFPIAINDNRNNTRNCNETVKQTEKNSKYNNIQHLKHFNPANSRNSDVSRYSPSKDMDVFDSNKRQTSKKLLGKSKMKKKDVRERNISMSDASECETQSPHKTSNTKNKPIKKTSTIKSQKKGKK